MKNPSLYTPHPNLLPQGEKEPVTHGKYWLTQQSSILLVKLRKANLDKSECTFDF